MTKAMQYNYRSRNLNDNLYEYYPCCATESAISSPALETGLLLPLAILRIAIPSKPWIAIPYDWTGVGDQISQELNIVLDIPTVCTQTPTATYNWGASVKDFSPPPRELQVKVRSPAISWSPDPQITGGSAVRGQRDWWCTMATDLGASIDEGTGCWQALKGLDLRYRWVFVDQLRILYFF